MPAYDFSQDGPAYGEYLRDDISPMSSAAVDPDEARAGQAVSQSAGQGSPQVPMNGPGRTAAAQQGFGTGRFSPDGNELPVGLKSRSNPSDLPDAQYGSPTTQPVPGQGAAAGSQVSPTTGSPTTQIGAASASPVPRSWPDYARRGMDSLGGNMDALTQTAQRLAAQPTLQQLNQPYQDKIDNVVSSPPDPKEQQYRRGLGSKILGGLEGVAAGIARGGVIEGIAGGIDPRLTAGEGKGYGDPNDAYYRDAANNQRKVAAWKDAQTTNASAYKDQTARDTQVANAYKDAGNMGKDLSSAATLQEGSDTRQQQVDQGDPAVKQAALEAAQARRAAQVADPKSLYHRMPSWAQWGYITTGKADVTRPPEQPAEVQLYNQAKFADLNDPANRGKPVTADRVRSWVAAARGSGADDGGDGGDDAKVGAIVADSIAKKQEYADEWTRLPNGSYKNVTSRKIISGNEFDAKMEAFRADANTKLAKLGSQIDAGGHIVGTNQRRALVPAGEATAPAAGRPGVKARPALPNPAAFVEGQTIYGQNGEKFTKKGGRWQ